MKANEANKNNRMFRWLRDIQELLVQPEPIYMTMFQTNHWLVFIHKAVDIIQLNALLDAKVQTENLKSIFHRYFYQSVFPVFLLESIINNTVENVLIGFFSFNLLLVTAFTSMHILSLKKDVVKFAVLPGQIMLTVIFFQVSLLRYPLVWWVSKVFLESVIDGKSFSATIFGFLSIFMMYVLIWIVNLFTIDTRFEESDFELYVVLIIYSRKTAF